MSTPEILAALDPGLASRWPPVLDLQHVEGLLTKAIESNQVFEASEAIVGLGPAAVEPDGLKLAATAAATCVAVTKFCHEEQSRMIARLKEAGVTANRPVPAQPQTPKKTHAFDVEIARQHFDTAIAVARAEGYFPWELLGDGALQSIRRTRQNIKLIQSDKYTTRLTLRWGCDGEQSRLSRRLRPDDVDYRSARLPGFLWPLYHGFKPLRLVRRKLFGPPSDSHLGQFLGTPDALIVPLLDAAGVTAADTVADLGCGDGRIVIRAAKERGCRALGIERDAMLVDRAKANVQAADVSALVRIEHGDAEEADLTDVSVVFLFLPVELLSGLVATLSRRLTSGSRIVAHEQIAIPDELRPDRSFPLITDTAMTVAHTWTVA